MATLRDVASLSGVSTATVSNVLNARHDRVSAETRERVLAAVRKLRYKPTALEKNQKAILTRNLGVVVPDITKHPLLLHGYFRECLDGIMEGAMFRGWSVTVFALKMWDDLGFAIRRTYDGRCDGLIVIAPSKDNETVSTLQERGVPLVLVGTTATKPGISSVDIDNEATGASIANYFVAEGHRKFAFVGDRKNVTACLERERGFSIALKSAGVRIDSYQTFWRDSLPMDFDLLAKTISGMGDDRPTAIFGWHDNTAVRVLEALQNEGLRVPKDVSVAGVDGSPESRACRPTLTTVPQHLHTLGKRAVGMLIDRLGEDSIPDEVVRFSTELILAESSGPAPPAREKILTLNSSFPR